MRLMYRRLPVATGTFQFHSANEDKRHDDLTITAFFSISAGPEGCGVG